MSTRLFVGNLSWNVTDDQLKDFFSQAGTVISATVIKDKFHNDRSKGFGFVEVDGAPEPFKALNGQLLDNRAITVNDARPQESRDNTAPAM